MSMDSHEIRTLAEYRALSGLAIGAIVITDNATGDKVHRPSCAYITGAAFSEKVLDNENRNGRYYHYLRIEDPERELGAARCKTCM
jgi:hypothetical protein